MRFRTGSLGCIVGVFALVAVDHAQAQFFPFFQQQQPQAAPQPAPPPARPKESARAPARKAPPPAQQKAAAPAPKSVPATAAVPFPEIRSACNAEIRTTCAGVVPGSLESVLCLRPNFTVHTPPCQAALNKALSAPVQSGTAAAEAETKPSGPAGTADAPRVVSTDRITQPEGAQETAAPDLKLPAMRPTQEARWVNRHCREDHSLLCQGVTFGQSRVLKCLLSHHSSLTNSCRKALARR